MCILQALTLDYLLALYPFLLIIASYFIIELYDRKFLCIVAAWKPFHKFLSLFRKTWDVRTSIIDSFATFFLLSNVKITSVSADLLVPAHIYQLGSKDSTTGLYYTPSVEYFGKEHRPYAILAIIFLVLFVGIPTLILSLYPFRFFQRFLSLFPLNWHFLHAFVDTYQGCYKDGTQQGTLDCRWCSISMLMILPALITIYCLTLSKMFFVYAVILLVINLIILVNIQPFKVIAPRYPSSKKISHILLSLLYIVILSFRIDVIKKQNSVDNVIILVTTFLLASVPIVYIMALICYWFASKARRIIK